MKETACLIKNIRKENYEDNSCYDRYIMEAQLIKLIIQLLFHAEDLWALMTEKEKAGFGTFDSYEKYMRKWVTVMLAVFAGVVILVCACFYFFVRYLVQLKMMRGYKCELQKYSIDITSCK